MPTHKLSLKTIVGISLLLSIFLGYLLIILKVIENNLIEILLTIYILNIIAFFVLFFVEFLKVHPRTASTWVVILSTTILLLLPVAAAVTIGTNGGSFTNQNGSETRPSIDEPITKHKIELTHSGAAYLTVHYGDEFWGPKPIDVSKVAAYNAVLNQSGVRFQQNGQTIKFLVP